MLQNLSENEKKNKIWFSLEKNIIEREKNFIKILRNSFNLRKV